MSTMEDMSTIKDGLNEIEGMKGSVEEIAFDMKMKELVKKYAKSETPTLIKICVKKALHYSAYLKHAFNQLLKEDNGNQIFDELSNWLKPQIERGFLEEDTRVMALRSFRHEDVAPSSLTKLVSADIGKQDFAIGRPTHSLIPLPLLFSGFTKLMKSVASPPSPSLLPFTKETIKNVDNFINSMTAYYLKEEDRQAEVSLSLGRCLGHTIHVDLNNCKIQRVVTKAGRFPQMDGVVRAEGVPSLLCDEDRNPPPILIKEVKNEVGMGGDSCPLVESLDYYRALVQKLPAHILKNSPCPCLQVTIAGPYIQFSMLAVVGVDDENKLRNIAAAEQVTDLIAMTVRRDDTMTYKLVNLFAAIKECMEDLSNYYRSFDEDSDPHFAKFLIDRSLIPDVVEIIDQLGAPTSKLAFECVTKTNTSQVSSVLKIATSYAIVVHNALAAAGLAPTVFGHYEHCGYHCVNMDIVEGAEHLDKWLSQTQADGSNESGINQVRESVFRAVDIMAQNGMVHGDMRGANLLVSDLKVIVVDFDWGGLEGQVRYPLRLSPSLNYPANGGDQIMCIHDKIMVKQLFNPPAHALVQQQEDTNAK